MLPGKKRGCGHHGEIGTCWGGRSRGSRSARPRGQHQNRGEDQVLLLGDCWELHRGWTLTSYAMETLICPIPPLSCLQPLGTRLLPSWAPSSVLDPSARICTGVPSPLAYHMPLHSQVLSHSASSRQCPSPAWPLGSTATAKGGSGGSR